MNKSEEPILDPLDAEALDFLVAAAFDAAAIDRMPSYLRANARRLLGELGAIDSYPTQPACDALIDATLARVAQAERQREDRFHLPTHLSLRRKLHIPNFVAVAAIMMIAVGVVFPVASQVRASSSQAMCASGLRNLGSGISAYASDNMGSMPMTAGVASLLPITSSGDAGIIENARHLEVLSQKGYCAANCTRCNGARNLSLRLPLHRKQTYLNGIGRSAIAADANPVQAILTRGITPATLELLSPNHGQLGQNVLFSDGSSFWTITPILPVGPTGVRDNIWVIHGKDGGDSINLKASSGSPYDIFLAN
ncbi:MAG: hypothetical protein EXS17_05845 [Phycisphaerales bacterium]|nr:hypothetical protein [Phycisphaerales bacterium]